MEQKIGNYKLLRLLGEGGMGAVYEGVHEAIERHVAIKVLHPEYARRPEFCARFFNEARAVNRIDHPGLVQISDYGQLPDNTAYIVMEYLKGESLGARLKQRRGPLELGQVLNLGAQIADALAAAHEKGIVHRDLKPDNVMVVADAQMPGGERSKLLDFGIAKLAEDAGAAELKTSTNALLGTPYYMSPEQCRGAGTVDDRSDVYSLGVMLYEMLSGQRPFTGEGQGDIVVKHITQEPELLRNIAPTVPEPVAALVHLMLRKDKLKRPAMVDAAAELESLSALAPLPLPIKRRHSQAVPIVKMPRDSGPLQSIGTGTAAGQSADKTTSRKRTGISVVSGVFIAAMLVTGSWLGPRLLHPPRTGALPPLTVVVPPVTVPAVDKVSVPVAVVAPTPPAVSALAVSEPVVGKKGKGAKRSKDGLKGNPKAKDKAGGKLEAQPVKSTRPAGHREIEE